MEHLARVLGYSFAIVVAAVGGALWPLLTEERRRLVLFLSFAAGVMLGAAFFHMLPEALESGGVQVIGLVPAGFLALFLLERYVLVHACEEPPGCEEHARHPAFGTTAFLGLSVHTLFDGVALASSVAQKVGGMAFLAIMAHKVPSSLSLASILKEEGRSRARVLVLVLLFGLMVPLGAGLYHGLEQVAHWPGLTGYALAFSSGTFLYIAVSDLLPHVNRHGQGRRLLHIAGLFLGLLIMLALSWVLPDRHGSPG